MSSCGPMDVRMSGPGDGICDGIFHPEPERVLSVHPMLVHVTALLRTSALGTAWKAEEAPKSTAYL